MKLYIVLLLLLTIPTYSMAKVKKITTKPAEISARAKPTQKPCLHDNSGLLICKSTKNQPCRTRNICPDGRTCIDVHKGYLCYHRNEMQLAHQHQPHWFETSDNTTKCAQVWCQNGGVCENGVCKCLRHFNGTYCENHVDYCSEKTCLHGACVSRLGGFWCDCEHQFSGRRCGEPRMSTIKHMQWPKFRYEPLQYIGFRYYYMFMATELGFDPTVTVDFGDGIASERVNLSMKRIFTGPSYVYTHLYRQPGLYNITVSANNLFREVFSAEYNVRVISTRTCTLDIVVRNAAFSKEIHLEVYRENPIHIVSAVVTDCLQTTFKYQWSLHTFVDGITSLEPYPLNDTRVHLHKSYLYIPAFIIEFGHYVVKLSVQMLRPTAVRKEAGTWLHVKRKPILAHLSGGNLVWVYARTQFFLDARESYDPNYPKDNQPKMIYKWACAPAEVCEKFFPANQSGPLIVITALELMKYTFEVLVNPESYLGINEYTGRAKQEVSVSLRREPHFFVWCLKNCHSGFANSLYPTALEGVVKNQIATKFYWSLFSDVGRPTELVETLTETEFFSNGSLILLYPNQLEMGKLYSAVISNKITTERNRSSTLAEYYIYTHKAPTLGICYVVPRVGYAMLTSFMLTCMGFLDTGTVISYEIKQFVTQDEKDEGLFVGYTHGRVVNLTLNAGMARHGYITTLEILATNDHGVSSYIDINVTVFPVIHHWNTPDAVLKKVNRIGEISGSPLHILLTGGDHFGVVQQTLTACSALKHLFAGGYRYSTPAEEITRQTENLRTKLLVFLHQVPMVTVLNMKLLATALEQVMTLRYNTVQARNNELELKLFHNMVLKLEERIGKFQETIYRVNMDDIGVLFAKISSTFLLELKYFQEGTTSERIFIEELNPFDVEVYRSKHMDQVMFLLNRFMNIYLSYKVPNERLSIITSPKVALVMKKTSSTYFSQLMFLPFKVEVNFTFQLAKGNMDQYDYFDFKMIIMDDNPKLHRSVEVTKLRYPFVFVKASKYDGSEVDVDMEVHVQPVYNLDRFSMKFVNSSSQASPFWKSEKKFIKVFRIIVPKHSKLLVKFAPFAKNIKAKVAVKRNVYPGLPDFWNSVELPQKEGNITGDRALSIFVDNPVVDENSYYYIGVLLYDEDTQGKSGGRKSPEHEEDADDYAEEEVERRLLYDDVDSSKRKTRAVEVEDENQNKTYDYAFAAFSVKCVSWNESIKNWGPACAIKPSTTLARVVCYCSNAKSASVSVNSVPVIPQRHISFPYTLKYTDNPLIPFVIVFLTILYVGLFKWAANQDHKDQLRRAVCFLVDNYPQCQYCYLVIVYTGCMHQAETTSNVAIELEGTKATSMCHILRDWKQKVMGRGSQDWFVLKTTKPLGEIYCVHLWIDYIGPKPSWYCRKVVVHDIQQQKVWFFVVEKWFDPISGDGTMSYTVYATTEDEIFSTKYLLKENIMREYESGMHGWFSIFHKHPYSNYTRKQRVGVAYVHMIIIMLILIYLRDLPMVDSPWHQIYSSATYEWETRDLILALFAVLYAFPVHLLMVALFRGTKPTAQWTESRLDRNLSRFNFKKEAEWIDPRTTAKIEGGQNRRLNQRVKILNDFFEPEGERKLRSRGSMQQLERFAGKAKVVPLRTPTSKIETEEARSVDEDDEMSYHSAYAQENLDPTYVFSPGCVYFIWLLMALLLIPCVYLTIFYGIAYGWIASLHYVTSFGLAILFSMFVTEPLKLMVRALYLFAFNRWQYAVEDRSDLVAVLDPEYQIPATLQNPVIDKINKLRKNPMYQPIDEVTTLKIRRNRVMSFLTRMIMADVLLLLLFILLISIMVFNIISPYTYLHTTNVQKLLGERSDGSSAMDLVNTPEDLLQYINDTLVANLQYYDTSYSKNAVNRTLNPTIDEVNYLIGTIRLRQVRKPMDACHSKDVKVWSARCAMTFDQSSYQQSWKSSKHHTGKTSQEPWIYVKRIEGHIGGFVLHRNESYYPTGAYVVYLGSTKKESEVKLGHLQHFDWLDFYTTALFVDFALYNPHLQLLTLVTLFAERSEQGVYYISEDIEVVRIKALEQTAQFHLLVLVFCLFSWLVWYINKESRKYSMLVLRQLFTREIDRTQIFLLILGMITGVVYGLQVWKFESYNIRISEASASQYGNFDYVVLFDRFVLCLIAFLQFFVTLLFLDVFRTLYSFHLMSTTLTKSMPMILSFAFMLLVLLIAFAFCGCAFFLPTSYAFRNWGASFMSVFGMFAKNSYAGHLSNADSLFSKIIFYLMVVFAFFFIFRWLLAVILMYMFSTAKSHARFEFHLPLFSSYTRRYFDTIDSFPNRKPTKMKIFIGRTNLRLRALGYLFVNFYKMKNGMEEGAERAKAMDKIALQVLDKRKTVISDSMDKFKNDQARALARSILISYAFACKFDYMEAKIDIETRNERYNKMLLSPGKGTK